MSAVEPVELEKALVQVRAAYRLIHAYQRRILDLFALLDDKLDKLQLTFVEWRTPHYSAPARADVKPFEGKWAWDLLPGYSMWCSWETRSKTSSWRRLFVHISTDTSFEDFKKNSFGEPDAERMQPVEQTSSALWISLHASESGNIDLHRAWQEMSTIGASLYDGKTYPFTQDGKAFSYCFQEVPLSDLSDEHAVIEKLIRPLEVWVSTGRYLKSS